MTFVVDASGSIALTSMSSAEVRAVGCSPNLSAFKFRVGSGDSFVCRKCVTQGADAQGGALEHLVVVAASGVVVLN